MKNALLRAVSASLALAVFAHVAAPPAEAQSERRQQKQAQKKRQAPVAPISSEGPLLLQVSLNDQRMYVYDRNGLVTQTRISSGRPGHDTPVGIYSILEKKVDHTSNIYLDAKMPHMQRLTQTGIALHGGVIPGHPASGGCVRLPFDFARRIFEHTSINERVVIAPDVRAPVAFSHPTLFSQLPSASRSVIREGSAPRKSGIDVAETLLGISPAHAATEPAGRTLESAAEARVAKRDRLMAAVTRAAERRAAAAEAEKSAQQAVTDARAAARIAKTESSKLSRAAAQARNALRQRERALKRAQSRVPKNTQRVRADRLAELQDGVKQEEARVAETAADAKRSADASSKAAEKAEAADAAIKSAQDAVKTARAEGRDAASAESDAKTAVADFDRQEANRDLPVSVFISSKTGKIMIRQGFESVLEADVEIANPEVPLNTFVFTAIDWADASKTHLTWMAVEVSENSDATGEEIRQRRRGREVAELPPETNADRATRTLDRITISKEAAERIAEVVKPGSALIVSDYDKARSETRYRGTDFIVQMPEVVAKITRPTPRPVRQETVQDSGSFFWWGSPPPPRERRRAGPRHRQPASASNRGVW
ncbi:hypothetical protein W911_15890 [Hyphomicrobium nitrativorans NL23]|uniref:L,D-TPase catalytic domain-containing protein n=1 Tax=Hyphomicrobium nitrativorans NL23 TaxID=1029756 RepID=V5SHR3_9HYPH|nr:hypothetical protein W911_15890 [Hyphomicrobium nitrativorans NL23]